MNIKNVEIKVGDSITIYTNRGANVTGTIEQIDGEQAYIAVSRQSGGHAVKGAPHSASGWYEIKVSARGIPYAQQ